MVEPWEYFHTKNILNKYGLPSGTFDPEGSWAQAYDIYFMNIRFKRGNSGKKPLEPEATLQIKTENEGEHRRLGITYSALLFEDETQIDVRCDQNALTSPIKWTQTFSNANAVDPDLVAYTQKGEVRDRRLFLDGVEPTRSKALGSYTADWCLFDAVQRLAASKDQSKHTFDMIEEFAMIRDDQTLAYRGASEITTDRGALTADVYCHYGESVIPTVYYVDEYGRLFLVVSTRRTVILKGEA